MPQIIQISNQNNVLEVKICNEKKANSLDFATSRILYSVFSEFSTDHDLRACIITGSGKRFFCAGWEYRNKEEASNVWPENGSRIFVRRGFGGVDALMQRNKPVIAAVNGMAVGGGVELIMSSDLVLATENAEFYLPETARGFISEVSVLTLSKRIPHAIAMRMILNGYRLSADEALHHGLVNEIVPHENLMERAREYAHKIVQLAPLACEAAVEISLKMRDLDTAYALEKIRDGSVPVYTKMLHSDDVEEGIEAFFHKRSPKWKRR